MRALAPLAVLAACHGPATSEMAPAPASGAATALAPAPEPENAPAHASAPTPVAVLELFTSEGCSSCPPADALLHELDEQARRDGSRVYALAFHVDYWNNLGWPDPFSRGAWTDRQREYARAGGGVYTPQLIVNGTTQFTGSDSSRARSAIADALSRPARATVRLHPGAGSVRYEVSWAEGTRARAWLRFAIVERGLVSHVPRGENAGKTLRHDGVVRTFESVAIEGDAAGSRALTEPAAGHGPLEIVGFVQLDPSLEIVGADRVSM